MSNSNKNPADETSDKTVAKAEKNSQMLYDFTKQGKGKWRIQNDVVMGGRSESQLKMTDENYALFTGRVSLENNGGFCSIHQTSEKEPFIINKESDAFILNIKGDVKDYNFRIRTPKGRHSYAATFSTNNNGDWETIAIPFKSMQATYRGEVVNVPNYNGEDIVEMQLLIGNKKEEKFEILVKSISAN
ncbi:CIA30 family protein [Kaistella antarctica]|uniref:Complex I intermediate-associated protein 30 (CIA30) n=2 Tax=Kaistella antarctica TaxID=266748 RepID=A0A448NQM9_9FLAO|nr:CIA30 family protein [Kaistella antarctica]SEW12513.1 Complex I intermediate-associated protein 30 (CIA30) [Kaistella antarctica]VEH99043.1 Complex I intermediate-associated protein 30 (CIA30) [Kaistella antarctica]